MQIPIKFEYDPDRDVVVVHIPMVSMAIPWGSFAKGYTEIRGMREKKNGIVKAEAGLWLPGGKD